MSTSPYNTLLSSIQALSQGKTLTSEQEAYLSDLNTAVANYPSLSRTTKTIQNSNLANVTKRFLETGNFTMSGSITFSGEQNFTGSVSLVTQAQLLLTKTEFNNKLNEIHAAQVGDMSGSATNLTVALNPTATGAVFSGFQVSNAVANYNIAFTGTPDSGTVRRYTIVTQAALNDGNAFVQCYANTYNMNGGSSSNLKIVSLNSIPGSLSSTNFAVQEITVMYFQGTGYNVFSTIRYY